MNRLMAVLMFFSFCAQAQQVSIFGFELGKPLVLPECPFKMAGSTKLYEDIVDATCVENAQRYPGYKIPIRVITFGRKERPLIVYWNLLPLERDGILVGVEFATRGLDTKQSVLDSLTEKFGEPSMIEREPVQNRMGAKFEAVYAKWRKPNLNVTYDSVLNRIDRGAVFIDLPIATEMRESWKQEDRRSERKL